MHDVSLVEIVEPFSAANFEALDLSQFELAAGFRGRSAACRQCDAQINPPMLRRLRRIVVVLVVIPRLPPPLRPMPAYAYGRRGGKSNFESAKVGLTSGGG